MKITEKDMVLAEILWNFCDVTDDIDIINDNHKSDYILALGSLHMKEVAERSAQLYHQGMAPKIISSGGVKRTHIIGGSSICAYEADIMTHYMKAAGVPQAHIINERFSKHTGGNYVEADKIIKTTDPLNKKPKIIGVSRPFVAIRAYLTAPAQTPHFQARLTTFRAEFNTFMAQQNIDEKRHIIEQMMGTVNRVADYPYLGLQIYKHIPNDIKETVNLLLKSGFKPDYCRKPKLVARDNNKSRKKEAPRP